MEYWVASWEWEIEMALRKDSWWMGPLEVYLSCSGRPWQNWRWKLFLASGNRTREPLSLPILHGGIHALFPSSSD